MLRSPTAPASSAASRASSSSRPDEDERLLGVGQPCELRAETGATRGDAYRPRHVSVVELEVRVVVGLEDVLDPHAEVAGRAKVLVDVEARIDDGGHPRVLVADQVAGTAEVVVDELAEDHQPTLRRGN
jgi:hypothetical protein